MLNPDGVSRGYWRMDTFGANLNRCYKDPDPEVHSPIYAVKKTIIEENKRQPIKMYVDFHAHCMRRGCFIFGNSHNSD
jgi:hypothetical protein